jgi:hypothetical protein
MAEIMNLDTNNNTKHPQVNKVLTCVLKEMAANTYKNYTTFISEKGQACRMKYMCSYKKRKGTIVQI